MQPSPSNPNAPLSLTVRKNNDFFFFFFTGPSLSLYFQLAFPFLRALRRPQTLYTCSPLHPTGRQSGKCQYWNGLNSAVSECWSDTISFKPQIVTFGGYFQLPFWTLPDFQASCISNFSSSEIDIFHLSAQPEALCRFGGDRALLSSSRRPRNATGIVNVCCAPPRDCGNSYLVF